jgi:NADPH-dependent 2,4-dienoyl-CoA reductase/sulfur reductase-like enzyme
MKVAIMASGILLDRVVRSFVETRIASRFSRLTGRIDRLRLELSEVPGTGGRVKRCRAVVSAPGRPDTVVTQARIGLMAAAGSAIDQAAYEAERDLRARSPSFTAPMKGLTAVSRFGDD